MKKLLKIVLYGIPVVIVLVIVALVVLYFSLGSIVKTGVEKVGPQITKTDVKVQKVSLSPFSGQGEIHGFVLGNPEGFRTDSAVKVGKISIEIDPQSVKSDVIVVKEFVVEEPQITYEASIVTGSNISRIKKNINEFTEKIPSGGGEKEAAPETEKPQKKIIIEHFAVRSGKIKVVSKDLMGAGAAVALPEIEERDIGAKSGGITAGEAASRTLGIVLDGAIQAVGSAGGLAGDGTKAVEDAAKKVGDTVGDAIKGLFPGKKEE